METAKKIQYPHPSRKIEGNSIIGDRKWKNPHNTRKQKAVRRANIVEKYLIETLIKPFNYSLLTEEQKNLIDWLFDYDCSCDIDGDCHCGFNINAEFKGLKIDDVKTNLANQKLPCEMEIEDFIQWVLDFQKEIEK